MTNPSVWTRRSWALIATTAILLGCGSAAGPADGQPTTGLPSAAATTTTVTTTSATTASSATTATSATTAATTSPGPEPIDVAAGAIAVQAPAPQGDGVFVLSADGELGQRLDPGTSSFKHPDWSPDGTSLAFVDDGDGSVWIVQVGASAPRQVLACDDGCLALDFPAFSPDGTKLAYTRYEPPAGDGPPSASTIRVLDLAAGTSLDIVRSEMPELVDVPRWSPDGTQLVVGIDQFDADFNESGSTIGVVSASGGDVRRLTDPSEYAYAPDWSMAGIVFSVETVQYRGSAQPGDDTWDLFLVQPDGTGVRALTALPPGEQLFQPAWTPDGTAVLATLQSASGGSRTIVSVNPSTGAVTPVSNAFATHPRMRP